MAQLIICTHDGETFELPVPGNYELPSLTSASDWVEIAGTDGQRVKLHSKTIRWLQLLPDR